jgi:hypothetical protein
VPLSALLLHCKSGREKDRVSILSGNMTFAVNGHGTLFNPSIIILYGCHWVIGLGLNDRLMPLACIVVKMRMASLVEKSLIEIKG